MLASGRRPRQTYPYLDVDGPIALAHRGGAPGAGPDAAPAAALRAGTAENSLAAFAGAVDLGYRYLETDVVATADGVLLTFHDRNLARLVGDPTPVAQMTYADIRRVRTTGNEPIATLEEVLGTWPDVRVNIDVKEARAVAPLVDVIRRTNSLERICVASFSERRIAAVRRALGPQLCTSFGPRRVALLRAASTHRLARLMAPRRVPCVQIPERLGRVRILTPALIDLAHENGQRLHLWTINDRDEIIRLLDLGVDGIVSDAIDTLRDVMIERGHWPQ